MSETLERPFMTVRLAPNPNIEPMPAPYCAAMERHARHDEAELVKFSDMLKECHKFGMKLMSDLYFAKELEGLPESVQALANAIADTDKSDIPYLWDFMS